MTAFLCVLAVLALLVASPEVKNAHGWGGAVLTIAIFAVWAALVLGLAVLAVWTWCHP